MWSRPELPAYLQHIFDIFPCFNDCMSYLYGTEVINE